MKSALFTMGAFAYLLMQQASGVAVAQESGKAVLAGVGTRTTATDNLGAVDGALSLGLTGERRPPYCLQKTDTLEISFTFTPEFNQTAAVQPDGWLVLKGAGPIYAEGRSVAELTNQVRQAYGGFLKDPEVTITLKDFQKPYFFAAGEVTHPGKYELRNETTVTGAIAISGGFTSRARHSQVVLFRKMGEHWAQPRIINVKKLLADGNLDEDLHIDSGDLIFVPQNTFSKIRTYMPPLNLGMYANPTQF
jgi:polysaccharide export outer membrane protein